MGRGAGATLAGTALPRAAGCALRFRRREAGRLYRPGRRRWRTHACRPTLAAFDCRNNRLADIALRTDGFADAVAAARARYGAGRIGVVVGTSTSGILAGEDAYRRRDPVTGALPDRFDYRHTHDLFSLARFVRQRSGCAGRR